MRRFKGQTIQVSGPERLLPTESTGIDLREARVQNCPPREGGYGDRPRRFEREERSFDEQPRRTFRDRDDGDVPRRAVSKRGEEEPSRGDDEECWRAGPSAAPSNVRKFDNELGERRVSRRSEEVSTPADTEDDWRAGKAVPRASVFSERRVRIDDEEAAPRRFGSRQEDEGVRRFASRQAEQEPESRADDDDWRRGPSALIERTRSSRQEGRPEGRASGHSATPWARKSEAVESSRTPVKIVKPVVAATAPAVVEWSSSEDDEVPDMQKIAKFGSKVEQLVCDNEVKKIDAIVRKVPVNFSRVELTSFETTRAVLAIVLKHDHVSEIDRIVGLVAPLLICLEKEYTVVSTWGELVLEEVQKFVHSLQLPRISPETSLVEQIWLSLYEHKVIAEEVFSNWLNSDKYESAGKSTTLFQTEAFRAWLYDLELPGVDATIRNLQTPTNANKDEWSDSEDDSDIESLVPKRVPGIHLRPTGVTPLRR